MKKIAIVIITAALLLACLAGCAADAPLSDNKTTESSSQDVPVFHSNQVVTVPDFCEIELLSTQEGVDRLDKTHYFAYQFRFKNLDTDRKTVNTIWFAAYLNNSACEVPAVSSDLELIHGDLSTNRETVGWVVVNVPEDTDWDDVEIEITPPADHLIAIWKK